MTEPAAKPNETRLCELLMLARDAYTLVSRVWVSLGAGNAIEINAFDRAHSAREYIVQMIEELERLVAGDDRTEG